MYSYVQLYHVAITVWLASYLKIYHGHRRLPQHDDGRGKRTTEQSQQLNEWIETGALWVCDLLLTTQHLHANKLSVQSLYLI